MSVVRGAIGCTVAAVLLTTGTACFPQFKDDYGPPESYGPPISRQADGVVVINHLLLKNVYKGRYVTDSEIKELQKRGLADVLVPSPEAACQGVMLLFDSEEEADDYTSDFWERHGDDVMAPPTPGDTSDPCEPYVDSPRFVTDE
ncbi:MAG: hypothetical protein LBU50_02195 [Cellulomonas sp.]|jgi:hypothetical protein|nr:hypothetical protein [Cellulomonas sp.]